jgi:hypothetical protein
VSRDHGTRRGYHLHTYASVGCTGRATATMSRRQKGAVHVGQREVPAIHASGRCTSCCDRNQRPKLRPSPRVVSPCGDDCPYPLHKPVQTPHGSAEACSAGAHADTLAVQADVGGHLHTPHAVVVGVRAGAPHRRQPAHRLCVALHLPCSPPRASQHLHMRLSLSLCTGAHVSCA